MVGLDRMVGLVNRHHQVDLHHLWALAYRLRCRLALAYRLRRLVWACFHRRASVAWMEAVQGKDGHCLDPD